MSDATQDESHEGPIKTPKQLIWTVVASFVVQAASHFVVAADHFARRIHQENATIEVAPARADAHDLSCCAIKHDSLPCVTWTQGASIAVLGSQ